MKRLDITEIKQYSAVCRIYLNNKIKGQCLSIKISDVLTHMSLQQMMVLKFLMELADSTHL